MDDLLEIRQQFIRLSGRYDLAEETDFSVDKGADWYIANGIRWLDQHQEHALETVEWQATFAAGDYLVRMVDLRVPKRVYFVNSDSENVRLKERSFEWMLSKYPKLGSSDTGTPAYWCRNISHRAPAQADAGDNWDESTIIMMSPTDTAVTVKVFGKFFQKRLVANSDKNFWSVNYLDAAVLAGLRSLEVTYRNTQGMNDYERAIESILRGIDQDEAESSLEEPMEMEG